MALTAQQKSIIGNSLWLRSIAPDFAARLLRISRTQDVAKGKLLYDVGDPAGGIFGVIDGYMAARLDDPQSGVVIGHAFGPGDWFGELPVLTGLPRQIGVHALCDCRLLLLPLDAIHGLCHEHPKGWRWLAGLAAINSGVAARVARDLLIPDPRTRFTALIRRLIGQGQFPLDLPVTQAELAEMSVLSRGAVSRIAGDLQREGALRRGYGYLEVLPHRLWRYG